MPTLNKLRSSLFSKRYLPLLLVLLLSTISILGTPFRFKEGGGGRYLLPVLREVDPALFVNDPIVDTYELFGSTFYKVLGAGFSFANLHPEDLGATMFGLYVLSKILLYSALFFLCKILLNDIRFFLLFGALTIHQKACYVGGVSLFEATITHGTIALLLILVGLYFLFKDQLILFSLFAGLSIFAHALMGVQLGLIIFPTLLLQKRSLDRQLIFGASIFGLCAIGYFLFLSPPSMSEQAAEIFISSKGTMVHVSPFNETPIAWVKYLAQITLVLSATYVIDRQSLGLKRLSIAIMIGSLIGLGLSLFATMTQSLYFVLIQPMRIFYWVTLLSYLLLALTTFRGIQKNRITGLVLLLNLVFSLFPTLWALPINLLGICYFALKIFYAKQDQTRLNKLHSITQIGLILIGGTIFAAWAINSILALGYDSFSGYTAVLAAIFIAVCIPWPGLKTSRYKYGIYGLIIVTLIVTSIYRHDYYAVREPDPEHIALQQWSKDHTEKSSRFFSTFDIENFQITSLRTSLTGGTSAMVWVDPIEYQALVGRSRQISQTLHDEGWDINTLYQLANEWDVNYVIVDGPYIPENQPSVFSTDNHTIFEVP